jgi:hypothetical protein
VRKVYRLTKSTYLPANLKILARWIDEPVLLFVDSLTISRNMKSAKQPTVNPACPVKFTLVKGNAHFTGEL